jgi:hypothetical protein
MGKMSKVKPDRAVNVSSSRGAAKSAHNAPGKPVQMSKEANKYIKQLQVRVWSQTYVCAYLHLNVTAYDWPVQGALLQPSRKHYGGMGYAKDSIFVRLDDQGYAEKLDEIWEEHIPGFSGKVRSSASFILVDLLTRPAHTYPTPVASVGKGSAFAPLLCHHPWAIVYAPHLCDQDHLRTRAIFSGGLCSLSRSGRTRPRKACFGDSD